MRDLPPNDAIAAATFFSSFSLRASKRSSPAPANAISLAIAAPTPLDAPVTRTVLPLISMRVLPGSFPLRPNGSCPLWVDTVEKGFWGRSLSNIDSRSNATAQSRFKKPFVRIRLFQILIPQLHFGDFFNSIGQTATTPKASLCQFPPQDDIPGIVAACPLYPRKRTSLDLRVHVLIIQLAKDGHREPKRLAERAIGIVRGSI